MQTLSFTVAAVPADASKVKLPGGAVSQKLSEASSGANNGFVSAITPGTQLSNIVLFIDTNQQSVNNVAATKWGWGGVLLNSPSYLYSLTTQTCRFFAATMFIALFPSLWRKE